VNRQDDVSGRSTRRSTRLSLVGLSAERQRREKRKRDQQDFRFASMGSVDCTSKRLQSEPFVSFGPSRAAAGAQAGAQSRLLEVSKTPEAAMEFRWPSIGSRSSGADLPAGVIAMARQTNDRHLGEVGRGVVERA